MKPLNRQHRHGNGRKPSNYRPAVFGIDGWGSFIGYYDPKAPLWNGWSSPYFTKEVMMEIVERTHNDLSDPSNRNCTMSVLRYDPKTDTVFEGLFDFENGKWVMSEDGEGENCKGEDIMLSTGKKHLYPVGAWSWVWDVEKEL